MNYPVYALRDFKYTCPPIDVRHAIRCGFRRTGFMDEYLLHVQAPWPVTYGNFCENHLVFLPNPKPQKTKRQSKTGKLLNCFMFSKAKNMEATYLRLAASSSRSGFADVYLLHVQARIDTSTSMQAWMNVKMSRPWYQKEQRAVTKLVTSLLCELKPADIGLRIVV